MDWTMVIAALAMVAALIVFRRQAEVFTKGPAQAGADTLTPKIFSRIDGPKEAAAVLLVRVAAYGPMISPVQKNVIVAEMRREFGADVGEAESLFSFGRMAVGQIGDIETALPKILSPLREALTLEEMKSLILMMQGVADAEPQGQDEAMALIRKTATALRVDSLVELDGPVSETPPE